MIYFCIDIGNTRSKIGLFSAEGLQEIYAVETSFLQEKIQQILSIYSKSTFITVGFISTAKEIDIENWHIWQPFFVKIIKIDGAFPFPIENKYATPQTLGTDRIVAIIAASKQKTGKNILVIDAGTALTYDFADANGTYFGGAISLGLRMRFRALHEFTARLPLILEIKHAALVGNSTENSLLSGVINGTISEIRGTISAYKQEFGADIGLFLTGGDAVFLAEKMGDIPFWVDETLVLKGIFALVSKK